MDDAGIPVRTRKEALQSVFVANVSNHRLHRLRQLPCQRILLHDQSRNLCIFFDEFRNHGAPEKAGSTRHKIFLKHKITF